MTDQVTLSEKELKALVYFVVGVSSEGNIGGRDVSGRLSFAGEYLEGKMYPVENSGLSIGTLQKDLGQDNQTTAKALVGAYQAWTKANHPDAMLTNVQRSSTIGDLSRNGKTINEQHNRALDADIKNRIDAFLASEEGKNFVHQRDTAQVDRIYDLALTPLTQTPVYQHASIDDRIKLATIVAKAFNQSERYGGGLLKAMDPKEPGKEKVTSLEEVQAYTARKFTPAMCGGRDDALRGAEIYTQLRHASPQNPLHDAWQEVLSDPLIPPTQIGQDATRPHLAAEYITIKNLFLEPATSKHFLDALEQGRDYSRGRPHTEGKSHATSGFFTSGTDFVQWNADGRGVAHIGGAWSEISREDITRVTQRDSAVDLTIHRHNTPEPLLHIGPTSPATAQSTGARALRQGMRGDDVTALQSQLAQLGYTDIRGRPLQPDGDFGATTHAGLQAFQRDHGLSVDGVSGPTTRAALHDATRSASITESAFIFPQMTSPDLDATTINVLQQQLQTLGMTDHRGQPLPATGIYDDPTRIAVTMFQKEQNLPGTGLPDPATRALIEARATITELQHIERVRPTSLHDASWHDDVQMQTITPSIEPAQPSPAAKKPLPTVTTGATAYPNDVAHPQRASPQATSDPGLDDPRNALNPDHTLYATLKRRIPDACEERLMQFTAACHMKQITANKLDEIHLNEKAMTVTFVAALPLGVMAEVDLKQPLPTPQQAIQQMQHYDVQRTQQAQLDAQLTQQQSGPTPGGVAGHAHR